MKTNGSRADDRPGDRLPPQRGAWLAGVYAILLLTLPFLALAEVVQRWGAASQAERIDLEREEAAGILVATVRLAQPESRFQDLAQRIVRAWTWSGGLPAALPRLASGAVSLFLYDPMGKAHPVAGFPLRARLVAERFFSLLQALHRDPGRRLSAGERSLAASFVGRPSIPAMLARYPGQLLDLRDSGVNRLGGWFPLPKPLRKRVGAGVEAPAGWHLLFLVDLEAVDEDLLRREALTAQQRRCGSALALGGIDLGASGSFWLPPGGRVPEGVQERVARLDLAPVEEVAGQALQVADGERGFRIFVCRPLPEAHRPWFLAARLARVSAGLLGLMGLIWAWKGAPLRISVRWQLTALFALVGIVAGASLLGFGHLYLRSREMALTRLWADDAITALAKIDDSFLPSMERLQARYRSLIRQAESEPAQVIDRLGAFLAPPLRGTPPGEPAASVSGTRPTGGRFCYGVLLATDGTILREALFPGLAHREGWDRYFANITRAFGRRILQLHDLEVDPNPGKDPVLSSYFAHPFFAGNLLRNLGTIHTLNLMGERGNGFFHVLRGTGGRVLGLFALLHDSSHQEADYLRGVQRRCAGWVGRRLFAIPRGTLPLLKPFPRRVLESEAVRRLRAGLDQSNSPTMVRADIRGRSSLLVGLPGTSLREYHLGLHLDLGPLERTRAAWTLRFRVLAGLTLVFLLLLARLLSASLLEPLREINRGVEHLTAMRWREPVTVSAADELGDIAHRLNEVMAERDELHNAVEVQRQLLPSEVTRHGAVSGRGWFRFIRAVTGRFFLTLPLPGGILVGVVGEARGRGILQGLLAGMYIAAFRLFLPLVAREGPGGLLTSIRTFFRTRLGMEADFAAAVAWVDPARGTVSLAGSGGAALVVDGSGNPNVWTATAEGAEGWAVQERPFPPGSRLVLVLDDLADLLAPEGGPRQTGTGPAAAVDAVLADSLRRNAISEAGEAFLARVDEIRPSLAVTGDLVFALLDHAVEVRS